MFSGMPAGTCPPCDPIHACGFNHFSNIYKRQAKPLF